ncbi:MAG: putative selenate reductase subunit YgfK [Desulfobulbaceae bacterium]|nr:putative selenate reductase subunit YgfK [Desulfobulbaceae bacterium]
MSDQFQPISADQLGAWVFSELDTRDSVFGIPRQHFFVPREDNPFRTSAYGHPLETPFGPAAGPHSQMAQNIVASWLCGARYIELKTVQTLDVLDVSKPCIDMEDEGYNVEWSQELKVEQSFDEYLRAWVFIHALHHKLGFPGESPGIVFNLSVGYDLEGIRKPNMQWFLDQMSDCREARQTLIDRVARFYPEVRDLHIPNCISDNVTLSTMHGCPPDEIENIATYLLRERQLHTLVKCNPTLLGPERVRTILNDDLQFGDIVVPDVAFEHDLKYPDAVTMLNNLQAVAKECDLEFGVKLSNTLEVENSRSVFDENETMMYLSGRPLHAITVNLAGKLADEFNGDLLMSFSAGANCFNAPDLLAAGMQTITVCSDLLKTGGYLRLLQYLDTVEDAFEKAGASGIDEFIFTLAESNESLSDMHAAAHLNLQHYAEKTLKDPHYVKGTFDTAHTKTPRELGLFDCIKAPCIDECPIDQKVPQYMNAVRDGNTADALRIVREDNPLACVLGRVCDHLCERTCIRTHLDEPVAIRDIKRFISDFNPSSMVGLRPAPTSGKVAIIGAGPGGMAAASELARAGVQVDVFEEYAYAGGMVSGAVPEYRLPRAVFDRDFKLLEDLGVQFHFGKKAGRNFRLSQLRQDGFDKIVIMVGAQLSKTLGLVGEDCDGVIDALQFLRRAREGQAMKAARHVGVIGAGDTAMDCARVARRQSDGRVSLIYRRTIDQMPADREEITHLLAEGIEVLELCKPQRLVIEGGKLQALECRRMAYKGDRDASGRKIPHEVADSDFEVPLDTLILAISQHAVLDFFDEEPITVNQWGYIEADPVTFETSAAGVYAGGDVVNDGPASIVKAVAAGKAIADSILQRQSPRLEPAEATSFDRAALLRRRSTREWRMPAAHTPLADRDESREVVLTYDAQQARSEAARCLDCESYCSLCVGVCPNLALLTYETEPLDNPGAAHQPYQVAVLADLCNECGNCTTFCPTAGQPYRDKPRLYLNLPEFEAQQDNAFMVFRKENHWAMDARWQGATHHIELNSDLDYAGDKQSITEPHASMAVLLQGIAKSMPHLPTLYKE